MSELKAFESERIYWSVEQVEREAGDIDSLHLDDNLFYIKSEADKVIADLEESHKREVEQLLMEIVKLKGDYKEACDSLHTAGLIKDEQKAKAKADIIEEAGKKYQGLVPLVYDIETMGLDEARPQDMPYAVYLKREADKVIANLEDELRAANEQIENLINSASSIMLFQDRVNDNKCDELRHQKYKRCLAMAKWCITEYVHSKCLDFTNTEQWYWRRWHIRWRNLAKKFKEAE